MAIKLTEQQKINAAKIITDEANAALEGLSASISRIEAKLRELWGPRGGSDAEIEAAEHLTALRERLAAERKAVGELLGRTVQVVLAK